MSHSDRDVHQRASRKQPAPRAYSPGGPSIATLALTLMMLIGVGVVVAAVAIPKIQDRVNRPGDQVASATTPTSQGKTAYEIALEEADKAQEKVEKEAEYTGVATPEQLDTYKVPVPPEEKDYRGPVTRPSSGPVVAPQLPPGGGALEVAVAIDKEIAAKLAEAKTPSSPLADDAEFLRRVYLDLTGRIPSHNQAVAFLDSKDPYKRSKLIDELLASEAYGHHFASVWTDLLVKRDFDNNKNLKTEAFEKWLAEQFNKGEPWNKTVHALITAEGKEADNPAIFFALANQDNNQPAPSKMVGATGNLFMGIQIQCAECHVHPYTSKWKPSDFWGMAAFFGHTRIEREGADKKGKGGIPTVKEVDSNKEVKKDKKDKSGPIPTGAVIPIPDPTNAKKTVGTAKAKFFEAEEPRLNAKGPYRPAVADWVTSSKNRYFGPAMANRTWAHFMSRGLVNPLDDMKEDNAPSHPTVLKLMADEFVKNNYDVKYLIRCICNTQAYQRTSRPLKDNLSDEVLYSHQAVKVMNADVLLESLAVATNVKASGGGGGGGGRRQGGNLRTFFDVVEYGDDPREYAYGIPHLLKMMNTNVTNSAYQAATALAKTGGSNKSKIVEDIYLTVLARRPSAEENKRMQDFIAKQGDSRGYGGVFWALLNSAEFVCNR